MGWGRCCHGLNDVREVKGGLCCILEVLRAEESEPSHWAGMVQCGPGAHGEERRNGES